MKKYVEKNLKEYQQTRDRKVLEKVGESFLPLIDQLVKQHNYLCINQDLTLEDLYSSAYLGFTEAMQEAELSIDKTVHKIIFEMMNTFQNTYQIRYVDYEVLARLEYFHGPFTRRDIQMFLLQGMDEKILQAYFEIKEKVRIPYTRKLEEQNQEYFLKPNDCSLEIKEVSACLQNIFNQLGDSKELELLKSSFGFNFTNEYGGTLTDEQLVTLNQDLIDQLRKKEEVQSLKEYLELDFVDVSKDSKKFVKSK